MRDTPPHKFALTLPRPNQWLPAPTEWRAACAPSKKLGADPGENLRAKRVGSLVSDVSLVQRVWPGSPRDPYSHPSR